METTHQHPSNSDSWVESQYEETTASSGRNVRILFSLSLHNGSETANTTVGVAFLGYDWILFVPWQTLCTTGTFIRFCSGLSLWGVLAPSLFYSFCRLSLVVLVSHASMKPKHHMNSIGVKTLSIISKNISFVLVFSDSSIVASFVSQSLTTMDFPPHSPKPSTEVVVASASPSTPPSPTSSNTTNASSFQAMLSAANATSDDNLFRSPSSSSRSYSSRNLEAAAASLDDFSTPFNGVGRGTPRRREQTTSTSRLRTISEDYQARSNNMMMMSDQDLFSKWASGDEEWRTRLSSGRKTPVRSIKRN